MLKPEFKIQIKSFHRRQFGITFYIDIIDFITSNY